MASVLPATILCELPTSSPFGFRATCCASTTWQASTLRSTACATQLLLRFRNASRHSLLTLTATSLDAL
eukprot:6193956-Pleurochrysis_carterae.AAC.4